MQKLNCKAVKSVCDTITGASDTDPVVIVETYCNGSEWYRKYSDGVIEQGGVITGLTLNTETSYNFVTTFTNADSVSLHLTNIFTDNTSEANYRGGLSVSAITTTGFTVFADGFTRYAQIAYWEARGI